jgi:hypothetical protein
MKALSKLLLIAALGGAFNAAAIAGPGPQFWNRPAAKPATPVPIQQAPALPVGLTCARMLVPNTGFSKGPQYRSVACTPEMMKNDWRCQQACAKATKG